MKQFLKDAALKVLLFVIIPLSVGYAAIMFLIKTAKDSGKFGK